MVEYVGTLLFHSETGTEGGYWAMQEDKFKEGDKWSYEGLHIIKDGDQLTIYTPDDDGVQWEGRIELEQYPLFTESEENMWIHSGPKNFPRTAWMRMFLMEWPCRLVTSE